MPPTLTDSLRFFQRASPYAIERRDGTLEPDKAAKIFKRAAANEDIAKDPDLGPAYLAGSLLSFNEQIERILELGMVLLVGAGLVTVGFTPEVLWFVPIMFFVVRPISVLPVWFTRQLTRKQLAGAAWFGIRGIGSVYYFAYAVGKGLAPEVTQTLASLVFTVIAASIVIHGVSILPVLSLLKPESIRRPRRSIK